MLRVALDPGADSGSMAECKAVLRCSGALLRRHSPLLPARAGGLLSLLLKGAWNTQVRAVACWVCAQHAWGTRCKEDCSVQQLGL